MASDGISKHKKMNKKVKKILNTASRNHSMAYNKAVGEYLLDDDGNVDLDKLDNSGMQDKFAKHLTDSYVSAAKKAFKSGLSKGDDLENDMLLNAYMGVTKDQINESIKTHGKDYNLGLHTGMMESAISKKIKPVLHDASSAHLEDSDIEDIIKYTKSKDFIDSKKIRLEEAKHLLFKYDHGDMEEYKQKIKGQVYFKKEK